MWYNNEDGPVAQLVEQRPEEPCVDGSSPPGTTINNLLESSSGNDKRL